MSERAARSRDVTLLGVIGAVMCCGLPILLGAGAEVTITGPELRTPTRRRRSRPQPR